MNTSLKYKFITVALILTFLSGCIIVKRDEPSDVAKPIDIASPKPTIPMSEKIARSESGDMIAFLPKDWFFVDLDDKTPSGVFAVAVNPSYTLSAVFSEVKSGPNVKKLVKKEGLIGLARSSLAVKRKKTSGAVEQVGKFTEINMGTLSFCKYKYVNPSYPLPASSAVFISLLDRHYEFALIPMERVGKQTPSQNEMDEIFRSILATIQY